MNLGKKTLVAMSLLGLISLHNYKVTPTNATEDVFSDLRKYDENIIVKQEFFSKNTFTQPLSGSMILRTGTKYDAIYRGNTSIGAGESDCYAFYDEKHDNKFIRMANYNGNGAQNTRVSFFYYDVKNDRPLNMDYTDHMNISFSYRFYASEIDRLSLDNDTMILRYQSRASANGRTGDVFANNLIINEPGDDTWHTYSLRLSTNQGMNTEHGFFYFYHNNIEPSLDPTFYIDIDNFSISLDDGINQVRDNGTFDYMVDSEKLSSSLGDSLLYPTLFNRKDYGLSPVQENKDNASYLRMNGDGNKSSFSIDVDKNLIGDKLYIDFDYKDLSYYNKANLSLMVNGKEGYVLKDILGKEFQKEDGTLTAKSYEEAVNNEWINKKLIISGLNDKIETIDFVLECDCDLGIDNLYVAELDYFDSNLGDYQTFKKSVDYKINSLGDYQNKYTTETLVPLQKAINTVNSMTENSSRIRLNDSLTLLNKAIEDLIEKGNLQLVKDYIDQIFDEMAGTNKNDYELKSYLKFKDALEKAVTLKKNSTKEEVDSALAELKEKYENLVRKEG